MAGSVVGHGISNMLFGGRSAAEQPPPPAEYANQAREVTGNCDIPAKGKSISEILGKKKKPPSKEGVYVVAINC